MLSIAITGFGTYWNFGETEMPTTEETVSYEEILASETIVAKEEMSNESHSS
jgi:hypothetical protein